MTTKPLSRRAALRAGGVSIALPFLDAMTPSRAGAKTSTAQPIPRMAFVYFPNGVNNAQWWPSKIGADWETTPSLKPLETLKKQVTVLSGLGHPNGRGGHEGADLWLTGAALKGVAGRDYANSVSVDQVAVRTHGRHTRFPSLELSALSGPGNAYHTHTLAFNDVGSPIPAENRPRSVFEKMFVADRAGAKAEQKRRIEDRRSILDAVLGQARSLQQRLGTADRAKLDEYLTSVREVERRVTRRRDWIDRPKPKVDSKSIALDAGPFNNRHKEFLDAMFDLMALAFQTDTTRIATFLLAREASGRYDDAQVRDHHTLSHHGGDKEMLEGLARVDQFLVSCLARFLTRLNETKDGTDTLLDHTMVLYGSGMNNGGTGGHSPKNLPLLFAGGSKLGIRQGRHLKFAEGGTPLCNVHLTMLQKMGVKANSFNDSTGTLTGLS